MDRSISTSLSDARDALVNAVVDSLSAYSSTVSNVQHSVLIAPSSLKLFPLYVLALLKQVASSLYSITLKKAFKISWYISNTDISGKSLPGALSRWRREHRALPIDVQSLSTALQRKPGLESAPAYSYSFSESYGQ